MREARLNKADEIIRNDDRMYWIRKAPWYKLTSGEKLARVGIKAVKWAAVAAVAVTIGSIIIGVVLGVVFAMGISGAVTGGLTNASRVNENRFYGHYKW